jgi:Winged helix-turn-helix DNA-binding
MVVGNLWLNAVALPLVIALALLRTLLKNPELSYRDIGKTLGLTKQRISQLANQMGIDAAERIRKRLIVPKVVDKGYPAMSQR